MNKGARVRYKGLPTYIDKSLGEPEITMCDKHRDVGFSKNRIYRVKAGRGDATLGLGQNLNGAFITSETQMVLTDDFGYYRQVAFNERFWELVEDCENLNPVRKEVEVYKPQAGL